MTHYETVSEGKKYPCDACDFFQNTKGILISHRQSVHEGMK